MAAPARIPRGCLAPALPLLLGLLCLPAAVAAPGHVRADESRYSLGAVQPVTELVVTAGVPASTWLGFYNIDGNVPTSVTLSVLSAPEWLDVSLSADGVSGAGSVMITVDPSTPRQESQPCDGMFAREVRLVGRGYVCVETADLEVSVSRSFEGGGTVTVRAVAAWDGQSSFRQERDFVYEVRVLPDTAGDGRMAAALAVAGAALLALAVRRVVKSHGL